MEPIIDIPYILQRFSVSRAAAAAAMFPANAHAGAAFKRKIDLGGDFSASQLIALAKLCGCEPGALFSPAGFRAFTTDKGSQVFVKGDIRVTLEADTLRSCVYLGDRLVGRDTLVPGAPISQYLSRAEALADGFVAEGPFIED